MSKAITVEKKDDLQIKSAACTDRGQRRRVNEDVVFNQTRQTYRSPKSAGLFLVCDGMGGHKAGKIASQLAAGTVMAALANLIFPVIPVADGNYSRPLSSSIIRQFVEGAVHTANDEIRRYARNHPQEASNMGTTITVALIYGDHLHIANVGDSRAYIWRSGQLMQITRDHTVAAELARMGKIDPAEISKHPQRNVLFRALGIDKEVSVDLFDWKLQPSDKLLLCSDGLWKAFPDSTELAAWLALDIEPDKLCQQLVDEANKRDGSDNISAVVASVDKASPWQQQIVGSVTNMLHKIAAL